MKGLNKCLTGVSSAMSLCEKCPNADFFWSLFSCIMSKYGKIRTRKNSVFEEFSHSMHLNVCAILQHKKLSFLVK